MAQLEHLQALSARVERDNRGAEHRHGSTVPAYAAARHPFDSGISEKPSKLTYYRFKDAINNTFDAARGAKLKDDLVEEISVDCIPLRDLVSAHCPGTAIDLLSVDCEGLDQEVLASLDWNATRPTVVIVEDFEQTWAIGRDSAPSGLRTFLLDRDYAPVAHSAFSFVYVDVTAFDRHDQRSGFCLDQSQLEGSAAQVSGRHGEADTRN